LEAPEGEQALTVLMGFASLVFMIVSLACNWALPFLFFNLTVMFFLLAGGMKNTTCARVAGWWGIWTSFLAFYCGAANLFKDMWGMDVLPQGFTKVYQKTSRVLFPRCKVNPDTGDIEDGGIMKGN
jgi:succinate-acetate transporter protein